MKLGIARITSISRTHRLKSLRIELADVVLYREARIANIKPNIRRVNSARL